MRDLIDLGAAPSDEACAQVGSPDYYDHASKECLAYIRQLRRTLGQEPDGARLATARNPHDFGTYLSVVCHYDVNVPASIEYAFRCESAGPREWDELARRELATQAPHPSERSSDDA